MKKKQIRGLLSLLLCLLLALSLLSGCRREEPEEELSLNSLTLLEPDSQDESIGNGSAGKEQSDDTTGGTGSADSSLDASSAGAETAESSENGSAASAEEGDHSSAAMAGAYVSPSRYEDFNADTIPAFAGNTYAVIHDNIPYFTEEEIAEALSGAYEDYSPLDSLGRCGRAMGSLGVELMPTESRGDIYRIHPSGWQKNSGYERSHLIAFQLAGENDNEQNLVTGTHFFNNEGMRPFEEMVGDYIRESQTLVLYRVTPIFQGDELVCRGALMEAYSVEDEGEDICYCIFVYNVFNPSEHTLIDYNTGRIYEGDLNIAEEGTAGGISQPEKEKGEIHTYIVNKRSGIFHYPDCEGVEKMSDKNKMEFTGSREDALDEGYYPCPICNP